MNSQRPLTAEDTFQAVHDLTGATQRQDVTGTYIAAVAVGTTGSDFSFFDNRHVAPRLPEVVGRERADDAEHRKQPERGCRLARQRHRGQKGAAPGMASLPVSMKSSNYGQSTSRKVP